MTEGGFLSRLGSTCEIVGVLEIFPQLPEVFFGCSEGYVSLTYLCPEVF
jgi:hypothetical protein